MDNKPKAEGLPPNQPSVDAQKEVSQEINYSGGNALLDADIAAQASGVSIEQPAVINQAERGTTGDARADKNADTTGVYPSDFTELEDEGELLVSHDQAAE
jgi:hypothetical protein